MQRYLIQREIGYTKNWTVPVAEFSAENDEDAKLEAAKIIEQNRFYYCEDRIRITKLIFEGYPLQELDYEFPTDESYERFRELQLSEETEMFLRDENYKNKE